jgi:hypothetical protein
MRMASVNRFEERRKTLAISGFPNSHPSDRFEAALI